MRDDEGHPELRRALCRGALAMGWMLMTTGNLGAAPAFKLKPAAGYFSSPQTLALLAAAQAGNAARVRQLVAEGADPNDEGPAAQPNRIRLLHYAVAADDAHAVRLLVTAGADPERDAPGFGNAFLFAQFLDKLQMLGLLLELKPPGRLAQQTQQRLLFRAVELPRPRALLLLVQAGIPIDLADEAGNTAFLQALSARDYEMAEWLLQQGAASVREPTPADFTPANMVQFQLGRVQPGSPSHARLARMQALMQSKGAVFPAPTPQQVREAR
jgi:ankyrin repeat protein